MSLAKAYDRYKEALSKLGEKAPDIKQEEVLEVLLARDEIQTSLENKEETTPDQLLRIIELDVVLREHASIISEIGELDDWGKSFQPSKDSWWWRLVWPFTTHASRANR